MGSTWIGLHAGNIPHTHAFWQKKNTHNKFDRWSEAIFEADCLIIFLEQVKFREVFSFFFFFYPIFKMKADKMNMKWRKKNNEKKINNIYDCTAMELRSMRFFFWCVDLDGTMGKRTCSTDQIIHLDLFMGSELRRRKHFIRFFFIALQKVLSKEMVQCFNKENTKRKENHFLRLIWIRLK